MEVTSIFFILLVLISSLIYYGIKPHYRVLFLLLISAGFIVSYRGFYLIYILLFTIFNYFIGLLIDKQPDKKLIFWIGIIVNIMQLILFRYTDLFIKNTNDLFKAELLLVPLGISFYTLQGIGYLINIKKGWEKPEIRFTHFCLFIIFYPKFLSGPIERSNRLLPQLTPLPAFSEKNIVNGMKLLILGAFQKAFIANQLYNLLDGFRNNLALLSGTETLIMIFSLPLVLYFDFAGYTNIALGISKVYGFELSPNFDKPFLAQTVSQFWRKFHMSLSYWFNDYIYKQVSFKLRKLGNLASAIAVFCSFLLFGVWHGSGINFILIGLMQSLAINYEFFTKRFRIKHFNKYDPYLGRILTYSFYSITLILFFFQSIKDVGLVYRNVSNTYNLTFRFLDFKILLYLTIGFIILLLYKKIRNNLIIESLFLVLMLVIIFSFSNSSAFIYQTF